MTIQFDPKSLSKNYAINGIKKLGSKRGKQALSMFSLIPLAACGGGTTGGVRPQATTPPPTEVGFDETLPNVFVDNTDTDSTLLQGSSTANLKVVGIGGDDSITTGSGNDIIRGGLGADTINAGAGDDIIVVVGTTGANEYSQGSISSSALTGTDLSSVLSLVDLNGQSVSEAEVGETINGGAGNDTLVIYGTADLTGVTISNINTIWINSDVTLTPSQLSNFSTVQGDGGSIIRVNGSSVDVEGTSFSDVGSLVLQDGATLSVSSTSDLSGITDISATGGTFGLSITGAGNTLISSLGDAFASAGSITIDSGSVLLVDDISMLNNTSITSITGIGTIVIDETKVNVAEAIQDLMALGLDASVNITNSVGDSLANTTTTNASGTIVGTSSDDVAVFTSGDNSVSTGGGDDIIVTSSGTDVIMGGTGADQINAGAGDDVIVVVGTTSAGQYTTSDLSNSAGSGIDLTGVLDTDTLNNKATSDAEAGESINGGAGNDTLVIYGTADITGFTLSGLDEFVVNSDVRITYEQFNGFHAIKGDGASIVRVTGGTTITVIDDDGERTETHENRGHGNNTDGQDDDNPGQGRGGPNFRDKDGDDEDEGDQGHRFDEDRSDDDDDLDHDHDHDDRDFVENPDGTITVTEIATIDLDWTRTSDIGTLSFENEIIVLANGMEDFAGITELVSDGNATLRITNENPDVPMELDLRLINVTGFAELDLDGDFNIIVGEATDFSGFGQVDVSGGDTINITFASNAVGSAVKDFDLSLSSFHGVDNLNTDGNARLIFKDFEQLKNSSLESVSGTGELLVLAFTGTAGVPTEIKVSELAAMVNGVTSIELGDNVTLINDDQAAMDNLLATVTFDTFITTSGNDSFTTTDGNDNFIFDVGTGWGHDTITGFDGGDTINLVNSGLSFGDIIIQYTATGALLTIGTDSIFLDGFDGVLKNVGSFDQPIITTVPIAERLDETGAAIDITAPSFLGVQFDSNTVNLDLGERLFIKALHNDNLSETSSIFLFFSKPDGSNFGFWLDDVTDFTEAFALNDFSQAGTYTLFQAETRDNAGNVRVYIGPELETLGLVQSFTVVNSTPDTTGPTLTGATISSPTIDMATGEDVFLKLTATDDLSGLDDGWVTFTHSSGETKIIWVAWDIDLNLQIKMDQFDQNGTWTLTRVDLRDEVNNNSLYGADALTALGINISFDLVNATPDTTPPTLLTTSLSSTVIDLAQDDSVVFTVTATDDIAGVSSFLFRYTNIDTGNSFDTYMDTDKGDETLIEPRAPGTHILTRMEVKDKTGNTQIYSEADLTALGLDASFEVIGEEAVSIESTVGNDLLIGGDGPDFFVFQLNWGQDQISDFNPVDDKIDLTGTGLQFADLTQTITADGLLLENGSNNILLLGLTQALPEANFAIWEGNDTTAPLLQGLGFASTFDATSAPTFLVTSQASDENSGLWAVSLEFTAPDGTVTTKVALPGTNHTISIPASTFTQVGTYTLTSVTLSDRQSNTRVYNTTDLANLGIATSFDVTTAFPIDTTIPVLNGISLSGSTYDAGDVNPLLIHLDASDAGNNLKNAVAIFEDSSGSKYWYTFNQDENLNFEFETDKWEVPDTFTLVEITLTDFADNSITYNATDLAGLGISASFTVTNNAGLADTTAPTTDGIITSSVPFAVFGDGAVTNFFINFTDDISGANSGSATYTGPTGDTISVSFSAVSDTLGVGAFSVGSTDDSGTYVLTSLSITDEAGNRQDFNTTELAAAGISHDIRVIGEGAPDGTIVTGTDNPEVITSTTDDEVFTLHRGDDVLSFGANFGNDTVMDFTQGEDVLDFSPAGLVEGDLDFSHTEFGLVISDEFGNSVLLKGFNGLLSDGDIDYAV